MAKFTYKARKPSGEVYSAEQEAKDKYEIYKLIRGAGSDVVLVKPSTSRWSKMNITLGPMFAKVKTTDKIAMANNLGSMLDAGLPLTRALGVLTRQTKNVAIKKVVEDLLTEINRGQTFANALAKHPKVFSPLFVSMVHAGEQGGSLADSLKSIGKQMEATHSLQKRIRGAMMYPAVIVGVMILVGVLMMIFVIPSLLKTFTELNVELPATTQFILFISNLIRDQGLTVLIVLIAIVAAVYYWSKKASGKFVLHALMLRIPLIGPMVQEVNSARAARTLSSLMNSGVEVVESLDITAGIVQNVHFRAVIEKAREAIRKGDLMSKIFAKETKYFPIFFAEMLSVGEETGKVSEMLANVATFYENDVEQKTKNMSTIIEPLLMVVIGAAVGFFAISMISPMYSLANAI
jgi:type IV pilus assembly protein PilC